MATQVAYLRPNPVSIPSRRVGNKSAERKAAQCRKFQSPQGGSETLGEIMPLWIRLAFQSPQGGSETLHATNCQSNIVVSIPSRRVGNPFLALPYGSYELVSIPSRRVGNKMPAKLAKPQQNCFNPLKAGRKPIAAKNAIRPAIVVSIPSRRVGNRLSRTLSRKRYLRFQSPQGGSETS